MRRSPSYDLDAYDSHTMNGADLSRYQDELARERNARTLTLRRHGQSILDIRGKRPGCDRYRSISDASRFPYLAQEKATAALSVDSELQELANQIISAAKAAPRPLKSLVHSSEFLDAFSAVLAAPHPPELIIRLLEVVIVIFPLLDPLTNSFIDGGICYSLNDFLSSPDPSIVSTTVRVLKEICGRSSYARDSALCLEIHTTLIQLALDSSPSERSEECCAALLVIFSNPDPIEPEILIKSVEPLFGLLDVGSPQTVASVLDSFVAMTNQHSALVHSLYDLGLFKRVVRLMDTPVLFSPTLRLIGNLSVAQPFQLRTMLDAGLADRLFRELESEHAADVFWVLSNLLEAVSALIMPLIDAEFVARLLEIIDTSSYDIQKESAFFLSTLILFSREADLPRFVAPPVIEVLVSMIGCGVEKVILRCIDTFGKLVRFLQAHPIAESTKSIAESDVLDRLAELLDDPEQPLLAERAEALIGQVRQLLAGKSSSAKTAGFVKELT
jgi:hypothetical protein